MPCQSKQLNKDLQKKLRQFRVAKLVVSVSTFRYLSAWLDSSGRVYFFVTQAVNINITNKNTKKGYVFFTLRKYIIF